MSGTNTQKQVGLSKKGQAKRLVIDAPGKLLFPGKYFARPEVNARGVTESDFFVDRKRDMAIPFRSEMSQEIIAVFMTEKEARQYPLVHRDLF
jgi:hypothetical protein